jgi:hypothetical protein
VGRSLGIEPPRIVVFTKVEIFLTEIEMAFSVVEIALTI